MPNHPLHKINKQKAKEKIPILLEEILAGESGPEHLRLQPMTSPYAQMDQMKNNSFISGGGGGAVTIINQGGTQSSNTTAVVVPATSRPAPIETGLLK